jgi:zinc/manganese transport system substrate-binding protein
VRRSAGGRHERATWRRRALIAALAALVVLPGCGQGPAGQDGAPSSSVTVETVAATVPTVAATTNILADVTSAIGGEDVDVIDLMPRGADPHSFGLSAAQAASLLEADLIIANGLGLEEGLTEILVQATQGGVRVVEIGPMLDPLAYPAEVADAGPDQDPHVWTDPARMAIAARIIGDELAALADDSRATAISRRAEEYAAELGRIDAEITVAVEDLPPERRNLVTNHHVFGYFADRYGFEQLGAVIPSGSTLASPSAADLADLADVIIEAGVPAIFAETSQPDRLIRVLAEEVGLEIQVVALYSESLGDRGGPAGTYLDMMRFNAHAIVSALKGEKMDSGDARP